MSSQLQVRLYRDSFNTPWGFRLQGGKDLAQPLSIQRVFSNSPAEGELQRGDLILAISGRDANELTHKQALDLIKHGGGQIQLVIQRPAPGRVSSAVTIKPQRPRAPSLQLSPVYPTMPGPGQQPRPLHFNPCYNPSFLHHSPSSPIHPPPWAVQNFEPKRVSKLSRLGGGGLDFVVDYGSHYGTVPRRRHSTQVSSSAPQLKSPGGNPARVTSLSHLGGGGYDFGADYCTLPRRSQRQSSQPPAHQPAMPAQGGYGFQPKKVNLTNLGGGGPEFGSDFTSSWSPSVTQPVHVHTGGRGPPHNVDMLNRVQESLDNISLSPRTPDYGYQAPPFASATSPGGGGGGYIPTGVRLDMEREQEERRKQQQQHHAPQYQQQQQQHSPQYHYEAPAHQPGYVPTGLRIEQQGEQEQEVPEVPVWQMRQAFMNAPARPAPAPAGKTSAPKVPRPRPGSGPFTFGVDYTKPAVKSSSVTWKPQPIQRPVNVAPAQPVHSAPPPWQQQQQQHQQQQQQHQPQQHHYDDEQPQAPPAWRTSLKSTGVKPWDTDVDYQYGQQTGPSGGGGAPASQNPAKPGERDWTQSAVLRMIYEEEHRGPHPQQQRAAPPPPAPKPQAQAFQQSFNPMEDEFGTSDF